MESLKVNSKPEMKHLGFKWGLKGNNLTLHKHKESRVSDLWSTTSSLVSSGANWFHPNSTSTIFRSVIIPKVLYGVEILDIDKYFDTLINNQCRNSLKSLWGISKHARNGLVKYYNLFDIMPDIKSRKVKFLQHLMRNRTTRTYLLSLLNLEDRSFSTLQESFNIVKSEGLDLINILLGENVSLKRKQTNTIDPTKRTELANILSNWQHDSHSKLNVIIR